MNESSRRISDWSANRLLIVRVEQDQGNLTISTNRTWTIPLETSTQLDFSWIWD